MAAARDSTWSGVAEIFDEHRCEAYARIARAVGAAPEVASHPPLPVLAAVRLAALQGRATDPWSGDDRTFLDDVRRLRVEVDAAVARGLVQFTEPLRMADLLPGLLMAANRYPGLPVHLVEMGACAGLLLVPERYRIHYPRAAWSPPGAKVALTCELDVPPHLLQTPLDISRRVGIDLAPVDPADPAAGAYLRSFAWSGDPARDVRLEQARVAVARNPPPMIAADAAVMLPVVLDRMVAREAVTVIVDSAFSRYLAPGEGLRIGRALDLARHRGPLLLLSRVSAESAAAELPAVVKLVDLSAGWRRVYAATDMLSERMRWIGG